MKYILSNYQDDAVNELLNGADLLFSDSPSDRFILFKSITGSGKTVMATSFMEQFYANHKDTCFVWLSLSNGHLHEQSRKSIRDKLPPSMNAIAPEDALTNKRLYPGDVLVLGWSSINKRKTNVETGEKEFANIYMQDGEHFNLINLWSNTRDSKTNIILLVDESHYGAPSALSSTLIDLIGPNLTIEITATPRKERIPNEEDKQQKKAMYIPVLTSKVIEDGIIKKDIKLNQTKDIDDYNSSTDFIIKQSNFKRVELYNAYKSLGSNVNPLVLIQIPDSGDGESKKEEVLKTLTSLGFTTENKKVAVWLNESKNKINLDNITNIDNEVNFLIFKQAIATGWDCPRAAILVKLRDVKSAIFDLQTLGRILRMPERKHYSFDCLNSAYVYTNSDYSVEITDYEQVLTSTQYLKEFIKNDVLNLEFNGEKLIKDDSPIKDKIFYQSFENKISSENIKTDTNLLKFTLEDKLVNTEDLDNRSPNARTESNKKEILYTSSDVKEEYEKFIKIMASKRFPYAIISTTLRKYFKKLTNNNATIETQKRLVLINKEVIKNCIDAIKLEYPAVKVSVPKLFKFENVRYSLKTDTVDYVKCAYHKHFTSIPDTEKAFERYLEELDQVYYWIKNTDNGSGFSIVYTFENIKHEFYPDYIVKFKDGSIGIYEVKEFGDKEKGTITDAKIKRLKDYCKNKYKCGLVEVKSGKVYIVPDELK